MSGVHLPRHESHGNHPMSFVAFVLILAGFGCAALWLVSMAAGNTMPAIIFALLMLAALTGAASIWTTLTHRYHHSPVLPDNTDAELDRYMTRYRT